MLCAHLTYGARTLTQGEHRISMTLKDYGVAITLAARFRKYRRPRVLHIKATLDRGERLSDADIRFLHQACSDTRRVLPAVARYPGCGKLVSKAAQLYLSVAQQAVANEQRVRNTG